MEQVQLGLNPIKLSGLVFPVHVPLAYLAQIQ